MRLFCFYNPIKKCIGKYKRSKKAKSSFIKKKKVLEDLPHFETFVKSKNQGSVVLA